MDIKSAVGPPTDLEEICELGQQEPLADALEDQGLNAAIRRSVRSPTRSYRYVLPTQLVAKLANRCLDCRSLQASHKGKGAFDARSVAHKVVVPFDSANSDVLGGSPEPYVNNPLRAPTISASQARAQKNKAGWSDLCLVLNSVEARNDNAFTGQVFRQVLIEIHRRLGDVQVRYPVPIRVSLARAITLIEEFLVGRSGGDRAQAVACALFLTVGRRLGLFADVRRGVINAADAASGLVADLECVAASGEVVMAVEVKEKELTTAQVEAKLHAVRAKRITEVFFVAQAGIGHADQEGFPARLEGEFARGQNVYVFDLISLARVVLALGGEGARREFLDLIGKQLDDFRSDIQHRWAWRDLLARA